MAFSLDQFRLDGKVAVVTGAGGRGNSIGRAYALVRERGLVSGEVGRGTFVLGRESSPGIAPMAAPATLVGLRSPAIIGKLRMDSTSAPAVGQDEAIEKLTAQIIRSYPREVVDYTRVWPASWQEAGSRWLKCGDWAPAVETIVSTNGAHAAIMTGFKASNAPYVMVYPADDDHNAAILDRMVTAAAQGCDVVCASRFKLISATISPKHADTAHIDRVSPDDVMPAIPHHKSVRSAYIFFS